MSLAASAVASPSTARITVVPLLSPDLACADAVPAGYGALLLFPSSFSSLLQSVTASFRLPAGVETRIRLFVDEGAEESYGGSGIGGDTVAFASSAEAGVRQLLAARRGGELTQRSFALLRDNDRLHALVSPAERSGREAAAHMEAQQQADSQQGSTSSSSISSDGGVERGRSVVGRYLELRVSDVAGGGTLRFQINRRKPFAHLIAKYEQHKGWQRGSLALAYRRTAQQHDKQRRGTLEQEAQRDGGEEEVVLSEQETSDTLNLSDGALLYAYKR